MEHAVVADLYCSEVTSLLLDSIDYNAAEPLTTPNPAPTSEPASLTTITGSSRP